MRNKIEVQIIGGQHDGVTVYVSELAPTLHVPVRTAGGLGRAVYQLFWYQLLMLDCVWSYAVYIEPGYAGYFAPGNTFVVRRLIETRASGGCDFANATIFPR